MKRVLSGLLCSLVVAAVHAQTIEGRVINFNGETIAGATVTNGDSSATVVSNSEGAFTIECNNTYSLFVSAVGYISKSVQIKERSAISIVLEPAAQDLDAVVVSGTLRPLRRLDSPVAVEVYTHQFLKKNPAPSIFESLQNVNGVRPQLNCSVCNTGDIHINGLEGPYTMITIDGMPIVSSLASVYGLFGIPTQLIERIEIVKGPASGLYGSEAIGGLINIITRSPEKAPKLTANVMSTSWLEHSIDLGLSGKSSKKIKTLAGVNYFNYQLPLDRNNDHFTDVTLQHRVSVFSKTVFERNNNRAASLAARYFHEYRWGGEMNYRKQFRGSDSIYAESIYTNRWEAFGTYQLPLTIPLLFSFSLTGHNQDAYYGQQRYLGIQRIGFGQLTWDKQFPGAHRLLAGLALRLNYYDDNSTATRDTLTLLNRPERTTLPGIFIQDEWKLNPQHSLLFGLRYDHHPVHKNIFTPRFAWKCSPSQNETIRFNAGTGFRVVSLFTEEHAALTGARAVDVQETLDPERSINGNLNYTKVFRMRRMTLNTDMSIWYSRFSNQIIADYDSDPNKIIYRNLKGHADSKGITINIDITIGHRWKALVGTTLQDVAKVEPSKGRTRPVLTERWSGTWAITYSIPSVGITIDYTGNLYGPMRLPLLSALDPRPATSPAWSIQNIQVSKLINRQLELFGGVKNLLNWTPVRQTPFIIARSHDPFDKQVDYDVNGSILSTPANPYALSFDPSYVYAPNQGIRFFAGLRFTKR